MGVPPFCGVPHPGGTWRRVELLGPDCFSSWEKCGLTRPWNDPDKDIDRKQTDENGAFFVLLRGDRLIGSVMAGYDGHRGSINYLSRHTVVVK